MRDLLVSAGTGSGKTVAFGLVLARRLTGAGGRFARRRGRGRSSSTPTRELAMQVRDELAWLFAGTGARIGCCTGGSDLRAERAALAAGLDIVVGTPGRLGDHLRQGALGAGARRAAWCSTRRTRCWARTSAASSRRCWRRCRRGGRR